MWSGQALDAAVRWGYMTKNPAKLVGRNRQPAPRSVRVLTRAELDAISAELSAIYAPAPIFAAATELRPEEWQALERRDLDRRAGVVNVLRAVSDGEVVELAKTNVSRRQVPLTRRALAALDALPARLDTPLIFPAPKGGLLKLDNFRRREWALAIEAGAIHAPARIYDLRSTFASGALAASRQGLVPRQAAIQAETHLRHAALEAGAEQSVPQWRLHAETRSERHISCRPHATESPTTSTSSGVSRCLVRAVASRSQTRSTRSSIWLAISRPTPAPGSSRTQASSASSPTAR